MDSLPIGAKFTIGQLFFQLRKAQQQGSNDVAKAINITSSTYLKIERGQRELSFLMALRLCEFFNLDLHEFISMLSDQELGRQDISIARNHQKKENRNKEKTKKSLL